MSKLEELQIKAEKILVAAIRDKDIVALALAGHASHFLYGISFDELKKQLVSEVIGDE